jgi:di/tricarboxylate transporter
MTWEIALTLFTIVMLFVLFVRQTLETELLALGAAGILLLSGILTTKELLSVFSNPAAMTVAAMFILSAAPKKTLVYHAGGYEFKDFLKVGVPMNILMWMVASIVIPLYWGL